MKRPAEVWSTDSRQLSEEDLQWWEHYRLDDKPELPSDVSGPHRAFIQSHTNAFWVLQARFAAGETMAQVSEPFSLFGPTCVTITEPGDGTTSAAARGNRATRLVARMPCTLSTRRYIANVAIPIRRHSSGCTRGERAWILTLAKSSCFDF